MSLEFVTPAEAGVQVLDSGVRRNDALGANAFGLCPLACCRIPLMQVIHVHVHVKPEFVEAFRAATIANASNSLKEPGVARFDVIQRQDDPARFVLVEVYRTAEAVAAHKDTAHYAVWRDAVADLMAEPRSSVKYTEVYPDGSRW